VLYLTCSIASCQLKPRITNANMLYGQLITRSTCHMVNWSHLNSSWSQFITVNLSWKQLFTFNFSYKLDYVWMHASMSVCTVDSSVCPKLSGSPLVNKQTIGDTSSGISYSTIKKVICLLRQLPHKPWCLPRCQADKASPTVPSEDLLLLFSLA